MLLHAVIRGRVQGVGFRYYVLKSAQQLKLAGWVRNLPNGQVEVEAQGDEDSLYQFEQLLWKGPHFSNVEEVTCTRSETNSTYEGFQVRR